MFENIYEELFREYPDVVTLAQLCKMIRIGDGTARKLLRQNIIPYYYIRTTYYIPKQNVIDYLLSEHYANDKNKLKDSI